MTDYADATIPDSAPDVPPPASDDPVCLECGTPLVYAGRGRKPKWCDEHKPKRTSGTHTRRGSGDVAQALAVLDGMYRGLTMGLMALSPSAAQMWNAKIDDLQRTNAVILEGDKALTRSICKMGQRGGKAAFIAAHATALAPVALTVRSDFAVRAANKKAQREAQRTVDGPELVDAAASGHSGFPNERFFA